MFHFRLQHVLDVRERLERLRQKEYSLVLLEWQRLTQSIAECQLSLARSAQTVDGLRQTSPSPVPMQWHAHYRRRLDADLQRLGQELREKEQLLEARRMELVESRRARRTLEILRDKQRARYEERRSRQDRVEMDEVAANYHSFIS